MTDNEKKIRRRFNIVDLLIILAVIAIVIGVALRYNIADSIGLKSNKDTVTVSFLITDIKETSADAMVIGDKFYLQYNNLELGELMNKKTSNTVSYIENDDGVLVKAENNTRFNVRGEIRATGKLTSDGFMLGGTQYIAAGKDISVYSQHIMVSLLITGIEVNS